MPSILVLEQDPRSLERIHHTLGAAGWRVRIVSDPAQAFAAAASERPDLVIVGASVSGSASVAGSFARRSGGPGVLALLPPGATASGFNGLPADELLADPFTDQELMAAVQRAGTAPKAKPAAPAPAAPRPESKLTSLDIFGDVLAEIDGDEAEPAPAPVAPAPVAATPVAPAPPPPAPVQPAAPPRPAPRPADDDLNAQLEKTLSGVFGPELMKTRPAAPPPPAAPPAAASPPVAPAPAATPIPPRPAPPRKPEPAGGDDDIDAILSRTLGNLDPAPRRPAAPVQPPRPAAPPVSPTAPPSEGTAVRRPPTAMDQLEELTRTLRSPAPPAAPQPRPAPPAPAAPVAQTPREPQAAQAPPVQPAPPAAPVPVFEPAPVAPPEPPAPAAPMAPPAPIRPEPILPAPIVPAPVVPEPVQPEPFAPADSFSSSTSPFGSDPFDLSALEVPPPVELPEPEPAPEEPVFELELEPEIEPEIRFEPEPAPEPELVLEEAAAGQLQDSQPGTLFQPPFPSGAAVREPREDVATTQRIPVTLDDTLDIPGAERFGQYTLLEKIAAGGMAEVWKARMRGVEGFQKTVAIKKILPHMTDNSEFIGMFIDEAKLAAQLSHPNIVHIYDLGKIGRDYYIAMEYVEGKDLRSILNAARRKGQPLPLGLALLIASRLASALDYAHRKRDFEGNELALVHRDVSPQNVLITLEGDVKLCDFGIAKAVSKAGQTQMGALKGKLQYMSPEQAWGRAVDSRSDIFSLGAVLFEMITGERLFSGDTEMSVLEAVRQGRIRTPRDVDPTVPPAVDEIVARALAYEVGNRFQSAGEMMQRIEAVLHETPPSPGPSDLAAFLDRVLVAEPSSDMLFMPQMPRFPQSVQPVPAAPAPPPGIPAPSAHAQIAPTSPVDLPESLFAPSPAPAAAEAVPVEAVAPVGDVHMEEPGGRKSRLFLVIAIVVLLLAALVTFFLLNRRGADTPPPGETPAEAPAPGAGAVSRPAVPAPAATPAGQVPPAVQPAAQPIDYEAILQEEIKKGMQEKEAELRRKYEKKLREEMARAEKAAKPPAPPADSGEAGAETSPPPR